MNSTRILIVDDEPDVCEMLYFKHKGLEAAAAQTDLQARVLLEQTRFDVVITDWKSLLDTKEVEQYNPPHATRGLGRAHGGIRQIARRRQL